MLNEKMTNLKPIGNRLQIGQWEDKKQNGHTVSKRIFERMKINWKRVVRDTEGRKKIVELANTQLEFVNE